MKYQNQLKAIQEAGKYKVPSIFMSVALEADNEIKESIPASKIQELIDDYERTRLQGVEKWQFDYDDFIEDLQQLTKGK